MPEETQNEIDELRAKLLRKKEKKGLIKNNLERTKNENV